MTVKEKISRVFNREDVLVRMTQGVGWHDENGKAFVLDGGTCYRLPRARAKALIASGAAVELTGPAAAAAESILALEEACL